ncbi:MAG: hypothetical protein WAX69_17735 [Victivallales bacterium]
MGKFIIATILLFQFTVLISAQQVIDAVDVQVIMPEPNGIQAKAKAVVDVKTGALQEIKIVNPGSGYGFVPRVIVEAPSGSGITPIVESKMQDGRILEIKVLNGGKGYGPEFPPEVWIEAPNRRALARAVLTQDSLSNVEIIDPGSGYVPPGKCRNQILGSGSWSGGLRVWINGIGDEGFAPGQIVKVAGPDGAERGSGIVGSLGRFSKNAPEGSDSSMINLLAFKGVVQKGDVLEFAGYGVKFNPAKTASLRVMADGISNFGFGAVGGLIPVENGRGFSTLRGLPVPTEPRTAVRALGYYAPGDGGGGVFHWNQDRKFAMPRESRVVKGGEGYRPGDVILLNGMQRFLVREIHKKASTQFPEGQYVDYLEFSGTGMVDVGAITEIIPVEYRPFGEIPKKISWTNSNVTWSSAKDTPGIADGPGSGRPFVKGSGDIGISLVWANDNGGSIIAPCGYTGSGRWDRLYDSDRNDIRFYGAVSDASRAGSGSSTQTDNSWAIQMAVVSCATTNDPAAGLQVWIPSTRGGGDSYLTGTININYPIDIKGNGGQLMGKPGADIFSTIIPPIDFPFNKNNLRGRTYSGFSMVVDESSDPTGIGGIADAKTWKQRRLYKGMRWDREHNSQRYGALTFVEAGQVSDRRYFGTDDGLDPEEAPPINDIEPARRIYHSLQPKEFSDYVVDITVDPLHRGFVYAGRNVTLDGGVPLFGSKIGPGKPGIRENFGNPNAGKAVAKVEHLFVPDKALLSYKAGSGVLSVSSASRVPLLEGNFYLVGAKGIATDADSQLGSGEFALLATCCVKAADGSLVLSTSLAAKDATPGKFEMIDTIRIRRSAEKKDAISIQNSNDFQHASVTAILAVRGNDGRVFKPNEDFTVLDQDGKTIADLSHLPEKLYQKPVSVPERGKTVLTIEWKNNAPAKDSDFSVVFAYACPTPLSDFSSVDARWIAGPAASLSLAGELSGSYKYRPGESPISGLKSAATIAEWNPLAENGPELSFKEASALDGFTVGMLISGNSSGAKGMIKSFSRDKNFVRVNLSYWNICDFSKGETVVPAFNERTKLGNAGLAVCISGQPKRTVVPCASSDLAVDALFASENPVSDTLPITVKRGGSNMDVIALDAASPCTNGKDYYPWRIAKVADSKGKVFEQFLDYSAVIDCRAQKISVQWPVKSPASIKPGDEYTVEIKYFAGSPKYANLPWPEWKKLVVNGQDLSFSDFAFISAKGGKIVSKAESGLTTGGSFNEGKDYSVNYDPASGVAAVKWKTGVPKSSDRLYIQYRKSVDDYASKPWGSPKHLSGVVNGAVLVDAQERFMGNFGWIDQTINFPGYPPALGMGGMNLTFRDLQVYNKGASQSTSGGIHIWANYDGNHENLSFQDTNYGFVMPVNLYYPWQNYGVFPDGSTLNRAPAKESDFAYGDAGWGGSGSPDFLPNRYQSHLAYTGGSEQSVFKDFQFRCGDVGLFVVDSMFYEMRNIWASGANSIDRPRGSVMVFGTPANGIEQFSWGGQFGPLCSMFGEQALNGDYPLPTIRCCACGGHEVDFSGVTQGRQVIWRGDTTGKAAGGRSTVILGGKWEYSMGVWGPATLRISLKNESRTFAVDEAGLGADGQWTPPFRNGATYYIVVQDPDGTGRKHLQTSFTYDSSKPLDSQTLKDAPGFNASNVRARVVNCVIRKKDFTAVELAKIRTHYAWSLLLAGDDNDMRVSPQAMKDRKRLILENGGRNKITDGPFGGE